MCLVSIEKYNKYNEKDTYETFKQFVSVCVGVCVHACARALNKLEETPNVLRVVTLHIGDNTNSMKLHYISPAFKCRRILGG